jgi:hypothetical protein
MVLDPLPPEVTPVAVDDPYTIVYNERSFLGR